MFWFAALVNGDGEHTQIQEAKPDAHGVLVSDISLKNPADENYEWKSIGEFKGIFDGQNHTISDFSMTKVNDESIGFFQSLMSDPSSLLFCYGNRNTNHRTTSKTEFICMKNMLDAIYCLNL